MAQVEVARKSGLARSDVSRLLRGDFRDYPLDGLFRFLMAFGCHIEIVIRESYEARGGKLGIAPSETG